MGNPSRPYHVYLISSADAWYVGSTTVGISRRARLHETGNGRAPLLWAEIQRVGWGAFVVEVLESGTGIPHVAEARWYDRLSRDEVRTSLNVRRPGNYPAHTPETKARISATKIGPPSPMRGKRMTDQARERMKVNSAQARKAECPQGHPHDETNTRLRPNGTRVCRACARAYSASRAARSAKMKRDVARRRKRYQADPEYRARILAQNREYDKKRKAVTVP